MDKEFYQYLQDQSVEQYPGLVRVLGEEGAEIELRLRLADESHMLHDEDLRIIGEVVLEVYRSRDG